MSTHWPGTLRHQRGKLAEEHFFRAWEDKTKYRSWMIAVVRPTRPEDLYEKTDALILHTEGKPYRIQIKSYKISERLSEELMNHGVVPLEIFACHSARNIRDKTCVAIRKFLAYTEHKVSNMQQPSNNLVFYKKGKKHYHTKKK